MKRPFVFPAVLGPAHCGVVGIGEDSGTPVAESYDPPFPFAGTIDRVAIDLN